MDIFSIYIPDGQITATSITAVAMQQDSRGVIVSIMINNHSPHKKLSVFVGETLLEFDYDALKWQVYKGGRN